MTNISWVLGQCNKWIYIMWFSDKWRKRNKTLRRHVNFCWRLKHFLGVLSGGFQILSHQRAELSSFKSSSHYINCSILGGSNGMQIYGNLQGCPLTTCVLFGSKKWHLKGSFSWKLDSFPKAGRSITPLQEVGNRIPIIYKAIYIGMKNSINITIGANIVVFQIFWLGVWKTFWPDHLYFFLNLSKAKDICKTLDDYMCLFNQNTFVKTSQLGKKVQMDWMKSVKWSIKSLARIIISCSNLWSVRVILDLLL